MAVRGFAALLAFVSFGPALGVDGTGSVDKCKKEWANFTLEAIALLIGL